MKHTLSPHARQTGKTKGQEDAAKIQVLLALAIRDFNAGQMAKVERYCLQVLAIDVRHADALYMLGIAGYKTGRHAMAEKMIRRAIAVNGQQPFYHSNLGNALNALGKTDEAIASFERALEIQPDHAEACYNLGNVLLKQKKFDRATALYLRALAIKPEYAEAWCNLGSAHKLQGKLGEAVDCLERALALAPESADLCCNLGDALHAQGKIDEAVVQYKRAIALNPEHHKACNCLCNANFDLGDLPESVAWCKRALELKPEFGDALMNRSMLQLLHGDFASGWRNYEVRWKVYTPRIFAQPQWRGEPLNGARILLHAEQGLGDTLQFLRYVPMVQAAGGVVVLDLPANLQRIAALLPGVAALLKTGDPLPPFQWHCPLMSLPLAFGTTLETIPANAPYLAIPPQAMETATALSWPAEGLRVGLAWTGSPTHPKNRARSVPLELLEPLFNLKGLHFFSLQMGPAIAELAAKKANITDLASVTGDMADTAAQMAHLDLVITIDTSMAHLAGALARPTWVLLNYAPDWRWLLNRNDSPWYPTARLYRQTKAGDWETVIERLQADLIALAADSAQARSAQTHGSQAQFVPPQFASAGAAQLSI